MASSARKKTGQSKVNKRSIYWTYFEVVADQELRNTTQRQNAAKCEVIAFILFFIYATMLGCK